MGTAAHPLPHPLDSPLVSTPCRTRNWNQAEASRLSWHTWPGEEAVKPGASSSLGCKQQGSGKLAAAFSALSPAPSLEPHPGDKGCPNLLEEFPSHTCTHAGWVGRVTDGLGADPLSSRPPVHPCWGGSHPPHTWKPWATFSRSYPQTEQGHYGSRNMP